MISRCHSTTNSSYDRYGARGISVCTRWRASYAAFKADMGDRPSNAHSLDRIDPNGNYEPGNCRWATLAEQQTNKRLSSERVSSILADMKAASADLLERAVLDRVRIALLGK